MNQVQIGNFIAQKRREKNMTQAALAESLGVSNKTISKWENGKCMPDYGIIEELCKVLEMTVAELLDGEEKVDKSIRVYDDNQILDLIKRTQELEHHREIMSGAITIITGIAINILHYSINGSGVKDFISGVLLGISVVLMLTGIIVSTNGYTKIKK